MEEQPAATPEPKDSLEWVRAFYRKLSAGGRRSGRDERRRQEAQRRGSQPFEAGRDPLMASDLISGFVEDYGWGKDLERAKLFTTWQEIVGSETAAAAQPIELANGKLIVRCRSTAWATQLRLMQEGFLQSLGLEFPELKITEIQFIGPNAPNWKRGKRSVPGRGPRDTYG